MAKDPLIVKPEGYRPALTVIKTKVTVLANAGDTDRRSRTNRVMKGQDPRLIATIGTSHFSL